MFLEIINKFKTLDTKIKKIMKYGFCASLLVSLIATLVLYTYHSLFTTPLLFTVGTILFKTSIMLFADFIICGFAFDTIQKQMI